MLKRILHSLKNELVKALSTKFLYLGLVLNAVLPLLCMEGFKRMGAKEDLNGFAFLANSTQVAVTSLIPIFTLIFGAILVAQEINHHTYRDALSRPIRRMEFLTAKLIMGLFYIIALVGINFITGFFVAKWKYQFGAIMEGEAVLVSQGRLAFSLFISYILILFPLAATLCFGFLISILSRSLVGAVGFALGLYIGLETFKFLIPIGDVHLDHYLFSSYLDKPINLLSDLLIGLEISWNTAEIKRCIGLSLIYIVLFLSAGFIIFHRRDLND